MSKNSKGNQLLILSNSMNFEIKFYTKYLHHNAEFLYTFALTSKLKIHQASVLDLLLLAI
jgi:hypothetical protein